MPDISKLLDDRFRHHPYLAAVAQEDVRFLLEKDRSYGASWKLAGGRSAWFMLRRKMDRMIEMLKRPELPGFSLEDVNRILPVTPTSHVEHHLVRETDLRHLIAAYRAEDIFGMIEADPSGRDGSVLAEVRDLRRYLLLVEAEMVARGVVEDTSPERTDPASNRVQASIHWKGHPELDAPEPFRGELATGDEWSSRPGPEPFPR